MLTGQYTGSLNQSRQLNVHEYHGIQTMRKYGIGTPNAVFCETPAEAEAAFEELTGGEGKDDR
jgi:hypothetical protein